MWYRSSYASDFDTSVYETRHSCAPVSKKWAGRSRARLFEKVKVEVREGQPTLLPPRSILPSIKFEVMCSNQSFTGYWPTEATSAPDLLKAFSMAPIERLGITGGALANQRDCIQEFIEAHSSTLKAVELKGCSLSAHNVSDIVLGNRCGKRLYLVDRKSEHLPPGRTDAPDSGTCSKAAELELYISGDDPEDGPADMAVMIAQHWISSTARPRNHLSKLMKANGDTLSSLRIYISAGVFDLPSLE